MSKSSSYQNRPKNVPRYNPIKFTKTARDKTRIEKTYTRKPVPYILPFLENPPLENRQGKMKNTRKNITRPGYQTLQ